MSKIKPLLYIVEDDAGIRELYEGAFEEDYEVALFENAETFFAEYVKKKPNLCILDIMLPGEDGYDILRRVRESDAAMPVIFVSAKCDEMSFVKGLNKGADDYMAKPFSVLELRARVRANLRRTLEKSEIGYQDITVDRKNYTAHVGERNLGVTLKEFHLLEIFIKNAGITVPRDDIFKAAWETDYVGETRTLDMHVSGLREKLLVADSVCKIVTVRGVGYRLE